MDVMILHVFVLSVLFAGQVTSLGRCCPNGWVVFEDSCYLFADETSIDWPEATHFCAAHSHSNLVAVESHEEDQFIKDQCKRLFKADSGQIFWMGATDDEVEGVWIWYNNHELLSNGFSAWVPGEPDDVGTQDCAVFYGPFGGVNTFGWGSAYCTMKAHPICELNSTNADWQEVVG